MSEINPYLRLNVTCTLEVYRMLAMKDARSERISANVAKAAAFEQSDSQARVSLVFSNYKSLRDVPFTNFLQALGYL